MWLTWVYRVMYNTWKKRGRDIKTPFWIDINLAIKKGFTFYQTRSNAIILQETLPAYCIPKVVRMETGEVIYEKGKREFGSEHAQRSEVRQLSRSFQSNQPILNPIRERTERPVITHDVITVQDARKTSRSQEIDVNSFHEETVLSERTETRCWNEYNPRTFIWRQTGFQRWTDTWENEETRCWNKHWKCAR